MLIHASLCAEDFIEPHALWSVRSNPPTLVRRDIDRGRFWDALSFAFHDLSRLLVREGGAHQDAPMVISVVVVLLQYTTEYAHQVHRSVVQDVLYEDRVTELDRHWRATRNIRGLHFRV